MRRTLIPGLMGITLMAIALAIGILAAPDTRPAQTPPAGAATAATDSKTPPARLQFHRIRPLFGTQERGFQCRSDQQMTHIVIEEADGEQPTEYYALGQPDETVVWLPLHKNGSCWVGVITNQPLPARFRR